ncbi:MAG: hypothetical protein F9K19_04605 [Rhizobiaceae bacterium]|nr:MAG: hypothetical protein F9K19_04605 [Rhizobiaceae bacterium]CAG0960809.1 hypothetical protein RHIZO_00695 [Rhizobiaceae bacterium]
MKLTRRHALTLALSAALALLSNMAAHAQERSKPRFIVVNASGDEEVLLREAYWNDFERDHGIKVIVDAPENFGKMRAMVESGNVTWALANLDPNDALRASRMDLLEEIDPAIVDSCDP